MFITFVFDMTMMETNKHGELLVADTSLGAIRWLLVHQNSFTQIVQIRDDVVMK